MPFDSRNLPEQEHSIKARSHELFVEPSHAGTGKPAKPFPVYLRETPADPMSAPTKILLWFAAIIVGILFLAAIWRVVTRNTLKQQPGATTKTSLLDASAFYWCDAFHGKIRVSTFDCSAATEGSNDDDLPPDCADRSLLHREFLVIPGRSWRVERTRAE